MKDNFAQRWNPIFLKRGNILPWERPVKKGYYRLGLELDGKTEIIKFLGNENLEEETANFLVNASSAMYLADIAFYSRKNGGILWEGKDKPSNPFERKILFSGGINIYRKGQIPGTEIKGTDLVVSGKLWTARNCNSDFLNGKGLRNVIFGGEVLERDKERVVENIIEGYETQERNKERAESSARHENYMKGAGDHHESVYGTFGRTPFSM